LLERKLITAPLADAQLLQIVDFHSPTAGEFRKNRGLDVSELKENYLPNFDLVHKETYNHIFRLSRKNKLFYKYDTLLKNIFPSDGALFLAVFYKKY
jgi:hypothetical protein